MLPGPIQVIACPHCGELEQYQTLCSGNTFGARVWTDGKQVAPMLPHPPAVVKCSHCPECYWLSDAREVGEFDPWEEGAEAADPAWKNITFVEEPTEEQYDRAIAGMLAKTPERERSLRIFAWWRANEPYRDQCEAAETIPQARSDFYTRNLESLVAMMDETEENDLLMKAELLRELGRFNAAKDVLIHVTSPALTGVRRQFESLCDRQDTAVRELHFP